MAGPSRLIVQGLWLLADYETDLAVAKSHVETRRSRGRSARERVPFPDLKVGALIRAQPPASDTPAYQLPLTWLCKRSAARGSGKWLGGQLTAGRIGRTRRAFHVGCGARGASGPHTAATRAERGSWPWSLCSRQGRRQRSTEAWRWCHKRLGHVQRRASRRGGGWSPGGWGFPGWSVDSDSNNTASLGAALLGTV